IYFRQIRIYIHKLFGGTQPTPDHSHATRIPRLARGLLPNVCFRAFLVTLSLSPEVPERLVLVLVVAAPPDADFIASFGGAIEPLVHAPEAVQSARIRGIRCGDCIGVRSKVWVLVCVPLNQASANPNVLSQTPQ